MRKGVAVGQHCKNHQAKGMAIPHCSFSLCLNEALRELLPSLFVGVVVVDIVVVPEYFIEYFIARVIY